MFRKNLLTKSKLVLSGAVAMCAIALQASTPSSLFSSPTECVCPSKLHHVHNYFENLKPTDPKAIAKMIPHTEEEVIALSEEAEREFVSVVEAIKQNKGSASWENTVVPFSYAFSALQTRMSILSVIVRGHEDEALRKRALEESLRLEEMNWEKGLADEELGELLFDLLNDLDEDDLSLSQQCYVQELSSRLESMGMGLDKDKKESLVELSKDLAHLQEEFEINISNDQSVLWMHENEFEGLDPRILSYMESQGKYYKVTRDSSLVCALLENCTRAKTREKVHTFFHSWAQEKNEAVLKEMISKREKLAEILGKESFAHYQLEGTMAGNPERVQEFLDNLLEETQVLTKQFFSKALVNCHPSVQLTEEGKLHDWDWNFVMRQYKSRLNQTSGEEIFFEEYFLVSKAIKGMLEIYSNFFDLDFSFVSSEDLWTSETLTLQVNDRREGGALLGHVILDFYPREGKFTHACCISMIPRVENAAGGWDPALAMVFANLPRMTEKNPGLLGLIELRTLFHEFGHSIHALFGKSTLPTQGGTSVLVDFVEMPSQILEFWLEDFETLRSISSHYYTGEPLPREIFERATENAEDLALFNTRQLVYTYLSLNLFLEKGSAEHIQEIYEQVVSKVNPLVESDGIVPRYYSFGHLGCYGSAYYSYLWSKEFARDVFAFIKNQDGLLNPDVGRFYVNEILLPGGSRDPSIGIGHLLGSK